MALIVEESGGFLVGCQVVPVEWAEEHTNIIKQLYKLCSYASFNEQSVETRREFRDFSKWVQRLTICKDESRIKSVSTLLVPLSNHRNKNNYLFIGYRNYQLEIQAFVEKFRHLLN